MKAPSYVGPCQFFHVLVWVIQYSLSTGRGTHRQEADEILLTITHLHDLGSSKHLTHLPLLFLVESRVRDPLTRALSQHKGFHHKNTQELLLT